MPYTVRGIVYPTQYAYRKALAVSRRLTVVQYRRVRSAERRETNLAAGRPVPPAPPARGAAPAGTPRPRAAPAKPQATRRAGPCIYEAYPARQKLCRYQRTAIWTGQTFFDLSSAVVGADDLAATSYYSGWPIIRVCVHRREAGSRERRYDLRLGKYLYGVAGQPFYALRVHICRKPGAQRRRYRRLRKVAE